MRISLRNIMPHPLAECLMANSALWGKELIFEPAQSIQLVAQSGKGKSTFLDIIYGIRSDYQGNFEISGKNTSNLSTDQWKDLRSRELSLLFQDLRLFQNLSARENLQLLPIVDPDAPKIGYMCERLQVDHLLDQPVKNLSLGQRQRFAIIRCLRKPFRWLLLDEPFSHLDEDNAKEAALLIKENICSKEAGLILTSLQPTVLFEFDQIIQL